jgi:hypothetical protein
VSPGCYCEGWGVSNGTESAWADEDYGGTSNLVVQTFSQDASSIVSDVHAGDVFDVTHTVEQAPDSSNLYRITVNIVNETGSLQRVLYRRVMDWDVEPTAFDEYVTVGTFGSPPPSLTFDSNDGFALPDPLDGPSSRGATGIFTDYGDLDQGALFDFDFGYIGPGSTKTFYLYYGAAASETAALAALQGAGVEAYSLAEPSSPGGQAYGQPVTFIFGFKDGEGGTNSPESLRPLSAASPRDLPRSPNRNDRSRP